MTIRTPTRFSNFLVTSVLLSAAAICSAAAIWGEDGYFQIALGMWAPVFLYCALFLDRETKMRAFLALMMRGSPNDPAPNLAAKPKKKLVRPWRGAQSRRTRGNRGHQ